MDDRRAHGLHPHDSAPSPRLKLEPAVIKVAQTLSFAHERGIVHRDIKPDNVIVGRYGEAVVLDWGIAKVRGIARSGDPPVRSAEGAGGGSGDSSSATRHGSIIGTPAYMAPEQAAGNVAKIDERTDVFALGALLYHLLTGRAPYAGPTVASVIARASKVEVDPLASVAKDAPGGIRAICEKAMSRAPDDRYQTAAELADALETFTAEAVAGRESSSIRWVTNGLTVLGLVIILLAVTFVWGQASSIREQGFGGWVSLLIAAWEASRSRSRWRPCSSASGPPWRVSTSPSTRRGSPT
jgi:eukaryotic-like serine/threonine-protein kinase